jgi:UDP-N-acetylmuramate: L-alanyl-gamma-D-glutamyl-meso-diaminopimelate ligase
MKHAGIKPPATIHLIGICGTGMGALAGLLVKKGFRVTGSDGHPYPPMSTELKNLGITIMAGYRESNLDHNPDLVIVGNVCRRDHPEAAAARKKHLQYVSLPRALHDLFLSDRKSIVISGTHGKTTTTSLTAYLLKATKRDPSVLVGGIAADLGAGYHLGSSDWFVVEGDEYDSAYFEKKPKFLSYAPHAAVITSIEHDHLDIYPDFEDYINAFDSFAKLIPPSGLLAVFAGDPIALEIAASCGTNVITFGVEGDSKPREIDWLAVPKKFDHFDLLINGESRGRFQTPMGGKHNLRNTLAALIMCHVAVQIPLNELTPVLPNFKGIKRRQEIVGRPRNITVYDDFAHHPTAVKETLEALAPLYPDGRLLAAFEPRSATACRNFHQERYSKSFDAAGKAIIAPPGRDLPREEILNTELLAEQISKRGTDATAATSIDDVLAEIINWAKPGDGIVLLSNGGFGGLTSRLVNALSVCP